jgi:hypothetical protein
MSVGADAISCALSQLQHSLKKYRSRGQTASEP